MCDVCSVTLTSNKLCPGIHSRNSVSNNVQLHGWIPLWFALHPYLFLFRTRFRQPQGLSIGNLQRKLIHNREGPSNTLKPLLRVKWDYWRDLRERMGLIWAVTQTQTHRAPLSSELSPDVSVAGPVLVCSQCVDNNNRNSRGLSSFCFDCHGSCHLTYLEGGCCVPREMWTVILAPELEIPWGTHQIMVSKGRELLSALRQHIDTLIPTPHHTLQDPPVFYWKTLGFSLHLFLYSPEFAVFDFTARTLSCVVLCCVKYHVPGFKNINFRVNTTQMNI